MNNNPKHIIDNFGRVHDYLRISLTERCNLRCFYCMPEEGIELRDKAEFMTSEEVLFIAKKYVELGVKKIRLTGGEPLIKKNAEELIRELGKLPIELSITTNAILADKFINVFKEAGIKAVNVSLDSLKTNKIDEISRRSYGDRILSNINLLIDEGFKVKVNAVVMKGVNDNEIIDFIEWTKDKRVSVRFIEFMPFGGNKWNWDKKVTQQQMLGKVNDFYSVENVVAIAPKPNDTAVNFHIKGYKGNFGIISTLTNPFCKTCNRIRLTADGKIKNCLFSNNETNLLSTLREGEDILPLMLSSIQNKRKERAGITSFNDLKSEEIFLKNRSMTTIGG
jgi:GTP 3',8-cyclase